MASSVGNIRLIYVQAAAEQAIAATLSGLGASLEARPRRFDAFDRWFARASAVAAPIIALLCAIGMAIGFTNVPAKALRGFLPF